MGDRFALERVAEKERGDLILITLLILLSGIGLAALFSASYHNALVFREDPYFFIKKQSVFLVVSIAGFIATSRISLDWVAPFGHRRINGCWLLPVAYRGQLRPLSADFT